MISNILLKIFCLDKNHFEFREKSTEERINIIINNHKAKSYAENNISSDTYLSHLIDNDFEIWSYCYNNEKENIYWKNFLPSKFSKTQNFNVVEFSYVLFIKYKSEIYCIIGGSGMIVIKKYLDNNFGIDTYQHFAKPKEDILIDLTMRSISGNISQKKNTYNQNQSLSDSLNYSEIPTKVKIVIRSELKKTIFKKYALGNNKALLEIGNYFHIKKKISYKQLLELIIDIHGINQDFKSYEELTLFKKVKEIQLLENLDKYLIELVVNDVLSLNYDPNANLKNAEIIELVHPSKLEKFYECNRFSIKLKNAREEKALIITERDNLYYDTVKYLFSISDNTLDKNEITKKIYSTNIKGFHNDDNLTIGNFFYHIAAEVTFGGKKYFRIDANWYFLADEFIKQLRKEAIDYYIENKLEDNILNSWDKTDDEDKYNISHQKLVNYYIMDKRIKQNIELCDILTIKDDKIYFIHVKDNFNTKMRDLYVQIILSAKRLWNDIHNNERVSYLEETLTYYNSKCNRKYKIDQKKIIKQILDKKLEVIFVMAYNNRYYKGNNAVEKIEKSESNIAKYSLVQTTKEMREFFKFKIVDISEI